MTYNNTYYPQYKSPWLKLNVQILGGICWEITSASENLVKTVKTYMDHSIEKDKLGKEVVTALIPKEAAVYTTTAKTVQMCGYNSVDSYLSNWFGRKFDSDDSRWYTNHQHTNSSGLPYQHTLDVTNDLVRPYGIGVSRVYIPKGKSLCPEFTLWTGYLGVNPLAFSSRSVSNKEYVDILYSKEIAEAGLKEANRQFRFEFVDEPTYPCIIFSSIGESTATASFASGGGHASYYGPRGNAYNWELAIQLDWIENIQYTKTPVEQEYIPQYKQILDCWECIGKDGKPLSAHRYEKAAAVIGGNKSTGGFLPPPATTTTTYLNTTADDIDYYGGYTPVNDVPLAEGYDYDYSGGYDYDYSSGIAPIGTTKGSNLDMVDNIDLKNVDRHDLEFLIQLSPLPGEFNKDFVEEYRNSSFFKEEVDDFIIRLRELVNNFEGGANGITDMVFLNKSVSSLEQSPAGKDLIEELEIMGDAVFTLKEIYYLDRYITKDNQLDCLSYLSDYLFTGLLHNRSSRSLQTLPM